MAKLLSALLFCMMFFIAGLPAAEAATRFGVVCVTNRANANIHYSFKVGNGAWERRYMGPGASRAFWHRYDYAGENRAPIFYIRYDGDLNGAQKFIHNERLTRRAAAGHSCREGSQYQFEHEPANNGFIRLRRVS